MNLIGSGTSPFVRKVRVCLHEKGVEYQFIKENPRSPDARAQALSPLGQIPVLEANDGTVLFDSPVIVDYVDALPGGPLLPRIGAGRWYVLKLQALADGLSEATAKRLIELRRPEARQSPEVVQWEERRIGRVLAELEKQPRTGGFFHGEAFGLADIAVGAALEYVDFRYPHAWREQYPGLARWLAPIAARRSFAETKLAE
jgi:glutathione S-transferase